MVRKKINATTDNSKWEAPVRKKFRKPRKPMTDEQKAAAVERLAKARAIRAAKNPDYGQTNIHESLRDLNEDHQLHPDKVKLWIKTQKDLVKVARASVRQKIKGSESRLANHEGYIRNMQSYLKNGDWVDMFYGEHQQGKIRQSCIALSYYWYGPKKGQPNRTPNIYYPDLGCVWTTEMELEG
jgi:hypothetical protein|tara:strand:+ start:2048 stop:2596 length:549 start_codon:yes stop_codon:yes gene_type:complete